MFCSTYYEKIKSTRKKSLTFLDSFFFEYFSHVYIIHFTRYHDYKLYFMFISPQSSDQSWSWFHVVQLMWVWMVFINKTLLWRRKWYASNSMYNIHSTKCLHWRAYCSLFIHTLPPSYIILHMQFFQYDTKCTIIIHFL